jgi:hypothetical protein
MCLVNFSKSSKLFFIPNFIFIFLLQLNFASNAEAFIVGQLGKKEFSRISKTHLLVVGTAHESDTTFQEAALTKGFKYLENYPQDKVMMVTQHENGVYKNVEFLTNRGVNVYEANGYDLSVRSLVDAIYKMGPIDTLDFFSHSSAHYGIQLSATDAGHIDEDNYEFTNIKDQLTPEAVITINGCNSGFYVAPILMQNLDIPVSGSLTSTDFQVLHDDGNFYFNNPQFRPPFALAKNDLVTGSQNSHSCRMGLCTRMKPNNSPYTGYWGNYEEGGLPFYKVFCPNNFDKKCAKGMAKIIKNFVSVKNLKVQKTFEDYKAVVMDYFCPIGRDPATRAKCVVELEKVTSAPMPSLEPNLPVPSLEPRVPRVPSFIATYSPFKGPQLECDFLNCHFSFYYDYSGDHEVGTIRNEAEGKVTTFMDEYRYFLKAFKYL